MKKENDEMTPEVERENGGSAAELPTAEAGKEDKIGDEIVTLRAEELNEKLTEAYLKGLNTAIEAKILEDMNELESHQSLPMSEGDIESVESLLRGRRSVWERV